MAGAETLLKHSIYFEIDELINRTGYNYDEVLAMDDGLATNILLSFAKKAKFDYKLNELIMKKK